MSTFTNRTIKSTYDQLLHIENERIQNGLGYTRLTASLDLSGSTALTGSLFVSGTTAFTGAVSLSGDLIIDGTASIAYLVTTYESASIIYASGSTKFGDSTDDTHEFTGSVTISGSLNSPYISGSFSGSYQGDGSGLSGVASTLDVSGSSGNGSVALSTQDLSIVGTSNEIETSVSGQTVTIGIPTNPTLTGNTTITGNLTVEGTTTAIDSTTVNIGDRILELNYAGASGDAGILVSDVDGTSTSGSLLWDASSDYWMAGALGSEKEIALLNAAPTTNTVLKANASGLLVDSAISDDGTAITISSNLIVSGLTAGAFLVSNGSKQLISVASSTDGDVLVSDGSGGYSATNTIDGGTF